MFPTNRKAPT